ncbi:PASTA domain-containing protein [Duncaniella muris]|jgi:beta-lactam-binding protein with PASTA domain|uniref:PASTA domain-containing protein n=1 Tax=Duncaniella muris TaxID=2094150 RepID=A0A2V1IP18_9BACT|nr:PASTA domain-containing protein [Duncaniella muris]ROS88498.1 PASTA domain-containing protein [Muribaculaceae bacterium Isolate-039 (Harlan)]ROS99931.1 PASTA domain-containing protein [Muribaculaceae bacterium Isolate-077 (Janvier)]ROT00669.1 PASTA domain-containing protein [Muribaculaceae bacterium Isolate-083 (Janvier)]ROT02428.1 PASTA domain-containing protein [Muribaculaceae bacterium Isolate-084 (Janvier)]GFI52320.1 serine/threonine-protein kinase PK-1 [Muribaculaceae bacterium]
MKKVFLHIGIMIIVAVAIGWLAMLWLDVWTRHDDTITVPPVKTLSYGEAAARLDQHGLVAVLSDSVYDKSTRPGTVIDQNPKVGTIVKEGREIYLTINAFSPKMVSLPTLTDISLRQAKSILEGLEIKKVVEKRVPSDFKDLVLAVRYKGTRLSPGARVPVNATIELEVGEGKAEELIDTVGEDSVESAGEQLNLF